MAMIVRGCDAMCLFVLSGTWTLILRAVSSLAVNRTWWPKAARLHTVRRRGGHKGNRPAMGETPCASYGHRPRDIVDMLPQPGRNGWLTADSYRVVSGAPAKSSPTGTRIVGRQSKLITSTAP